jgi:hypothetical protein
MSIASRLNQRSVEISHDISERLRFARLKALDSQKPSPVWARELQLSAQGGLAVSAGRSDKPGLWSLLGSVVPPALLLFGFVAFMGDAQTERIEEIARIDAELLADDVPPVAFADPGFVQFLQEATRLQKRND